MPLTNVVSILQVGFAGFAFLMVYLGYRLLSAEQRREKSARLNILKSIRRFNWLTLLFSVLVVVSNLADGIITSYVQTDSVMQAEEAGTCRDGLDRLIYADTKVAKDYSTLLNAVHDAAAGCRSTLKRLDRATPRARGK